MDTTSNGKFYRGLDLRIITVEPKWPEDRMGASYRDQHLMCGATNIDN